MLKVNGGLGQQIIAMVFRWVRAYWLIKGILIAQKIFLQDLSVTVKTHSDVTFRDDSERHVIHQKNFIDAQEYYLYKYVESFYDGQLPPTHQHFRHKRLSNENDKAGNIKHELVVSGKVARRFGFYIFNMFFILVGDFNSDGLEWNIMCRNCTIALLYVTTTAHQI